MSSARWVSGAVPALGGITSEGIKNQLGRPALDRLTVLVRESAQNSWDAADRSSHDPVEFAIDISTLRGKALAAWRKKVAAGAPGPEHLDLVPCLESAAPLILTVSDRNTTGLAGPTRGDAIQPEETANSGPLDYYNFVLMVGAPRDTHLGGGTYGFGKASYYGASAASTIVISTRCRNDEGELEHRLVGCALGHSYVEDGRMFTGRHWWGAKASDPAAIEPLRNHDAEALADRLGLPPFEGDQLGTSIAIVCPQLDGRTPEEAASHIAEAMLWHLWPKMLNDDDGTPEMTFSVSLEGEPLDVPHPSTHPALRLFVDAYETQRAASRSRLLACGNPRQDLGRLGLERTFLPPPALSEVAVEAGLHDGVHHVCLMRSANLVVKYLAGPPMPDEHVWYAGVFKPGDELDDTFAEAEPPTHDDWVTTQLVGDDRTFVNTTFTRLREALREFTAPLEPQPEGSEAMPLGAASRSLGGLIARATGFGASTGESVAGRPGGRSPVRLVGEPQWTRHDDTEVLAQELAVETGKTLTITPALAIAVWGGGTGGGDASAAGPEPQFVGWQAPDGTLHTDTALALSPRDNGAWHMLVAPPEDAMISLGIRQATETPAE